MIIYRTRLFAGDETDIRENVRMAQKFTPARIKSVSKQLETVQNPGQLAMAMYSKREVVPDDIAKEGRKSGVIQKDRQGHWRIISYKTNPPEFWDAHYETREDAEKALRAYQSHKRH